MNIQESREHALNNFNILRDKSKTEYPYGRYRGYSTGKTYFERKDNAPFTAQDLEILKSWSSSRFSRVVGEVGDTEVHVAWTHDSTD